MNNLGFSSLKCPFFMKLQKAATLRQSLRMAEYSENKVKILLYRVALGKYSHNINVPYFKYATKYVDALDNAKVTWLA